MSNAIAAAGGVVWRVTRSGVRIAVIHRPHRDDWSLPKGKLQPREAMIAAAEREVVEETGLEVAVQNELGRTRYRLGASIKTVRYWSMRYCGGSFVANAEADLMRWVSPENAHRLLTFDGDHAMVDLFTRQPLVDTTVLLVRHGKAGKRSTWKKDDRLRPLDTHGQRQSTAIAELGALFGPKRIISAPLVRCQQTVAPLAKAVGLEVGAAPAFSDTQFERRPQRTVDALEAFARTRRVSVIASQGVVIPGLLDYLCPQASAHDARKGSVWAVFFADGQLVSADYYARPGSA